MEKLMEAFQELQLLEEDVFNITADGVEEVKAFMDAPEDELDVVIDPLAETEEELEDSYIGKIIEECVICKSMIYRDPEEVVLNEEGLSNVDVECPYCFSTDGFTVIGEVAKFNPNIEITVDEEGVYKESEKDEDKENIDTEEKENSKEDKDLEPNNESSIEPEAEDKESKEELNESKKLKEDKSTDYDINLAEYIYDNLDVKVNRGGYVSFDEDVLTYEDVINDYDDRITRKAFNKTKSIVVKALQEDDLKFYTPYNSDTLIELSDNHTLWDINVSIDEVGYGIILEQYLEKFTQETGVEIFTEGRSGRHICVHNTVDNLIRFSELQEVQSRLESEMIEVINTNYGEELKESKKLKEDLSTDYSVFTQQDEEYVDGAWEQESDDDALFGKDGKFGLIVTGNRDKQKFYFVDKNYLDEIKEAFEEYDKQELFNKLKEITGKEYVAHEVTGYSQGDWQYFYYPKNEFTLDWIKRLGDAYIGTYNEFYDEDGTRYYTYDSLNKSDKEQLSEQSGIALDKIKIRKISGYTRTPNYIEESLNKEEKRFNDGKFTKEELKKLRSDIVLDSYFISDYENSFNLNPEKISKFFEGYSDYLNEIKEDPQDEDTSNDYDNIDTLERWYFIVENPLGDPLEESFEDEHMGGTHTKRKTKKKSKKEDLKESTTIKIDGDADIKVDSEESVKVDVEDEVKETGDEMIAPLNKETKDKIEKEVEIDFDEFDQDKFDDLQERYFKENFSNVRSYKTTLGKIRGNSLILEGIIEFKSGNKKKTTFIYESKSVTKDNKLKFIGENKQFTNRNKAFLLTGNVKGKKLMVESLSYDHSILNTETKELKRLSGNLK